MFPSQPEVFAMIRLLSTDFDGTLIPANTRGPFCASLAQKFAELRHNGAVWAINTGRSLQHTMDGIRHHQIAEQPDYVLTSERDVFESDGAGGWRPMGDWNTACEHAHTSLFEKCSHLLHELVDWVKLETQAYVEFNGSRLSGFIASSEPELARIVTKMDCLREHEPQLHYQRNSIYLRLCHADYHKGAALGELQRLIGISREDTFAVGDNLNDLSMLDGTYAELTACPANSVDQVKVLVREAGGYVASGDDAKGVLEALEYFEAE